MKRWGAFALLCLIQSFCWIALEHSSSGITSTSCAAGALLAAAVLFVLPASSSLGTLGSVCLIVGPWLQLLLDSDMPQSSAVALALTLVPVVIAVAEPALGNREFSPAKLWPGLATATALMIVAPLPSFADWRADVVLVFTPIVVGVRCVLCKSHLSAKKNMGVAPAVSAAIFAAMALGSSLLRKQHATASLPVILISAVTFGLLLLAIRELSPQQYAAQFAIVPLLALLQGPFVLSWEIVSWRFLFAALLLLAASVALLRDTPPDFEEKLA